ncbi:hypothetical protein IGB42_04088 [Andreprevotia sp. IGB-42]|uniref:PRC-barrel domain-containing protein n=1 Tax=Andreprevotia sp. IGB-42 TaxID=2497473 RepID=UPI00135CC6DB|nr:PRC-barrel domain-containing protein [Andreprevotia sp. IGB-42]KAF0811470.1 hypothetical protein IGB42_04088 [Andreprevotia sp. IGB-42]
MSNFNPNIRTTEANLNTPLTAGGYDANSVSGRSTGGARIIGTPESLQSGEGPGPYLMLADTLEGNDVINLQGEDLGEIKGLMLDVERGRVAYAVLSFGGFLGLGDKLFAIPFSALILDTDNKQFVLNESRDRLKTAPGFDKDHWPSMADERWAHEIHTYYNASPYWE